jgi:hypothetical protein
MAITALDRTQFMDDDAKGVFSAIYNGHTGSRDSIIKYIPVDTVDEGQGTDKIFVDEGPTAAITSRPIGGAYTEGTGSYKNRGWKVGNYGSRASVDEFYMMQRGGSKLMDDQMTRKGQAIQRKVNYDSVYGDSAVNVNSTDGIAKWIPPSNVVAITDIDSTLTTGANITGSNTTNLLQCQRAVLEALDLGVRHVGGINDPMVKIICNDDVQRTVTKAVRDLGWFGISGPYYDKQMEDIRGYPFLVMGSKNPVETYQDSLKDANAVIPNNKSFGGTAICTEIFFVRFGVDDGFHFKQLRDLNVRDEGLIQGANQYVKQIDWYLATYTRVLSCLAKLTGVKVIPTARP